MPIDRPPSGAQPRDIAREPGQTDGGQPAGRPDPSRRQSAKSSQADARPPTEQNASRASARSVARPTPIVDELTSDARSPASPQQPSAPGVLGRAAVGKVRPTLAQAQQLRETLASQGRLPRGKFSPSVLLLEDGRKLYLSNRLEHGSYGKYRLGVMDGQRLGVKELRTPAQVALQNHPGQPKVTGVTPWQAARAEIALLQASFTDLKVQEVIEHRGRLYLLMEPMQASVQDVAQKMNRLRSSPDQRAAVSLRTLHDAAQSLDAIHQQGWLHRDIKPENLFVAEDGQVRVGDVGLAVSLADGAKLSLLAGTPRFIAPEVFGGYLASPASDVWGLGLSFAEVLTGRHPLDLPRLRNLTEPERLLAYVDWHNDLPLHANGLSDLRGLSRGARGGFDDYFADMRRTHGRTITQTVVDLMLHPDPHQRTSAAELSVWGLDRLRLSDAVNTAQTTLSTLAAPGLERRRQRMALSAFARSDSDSLSHSATSSGSPTSTSSDRSSQQALSLHLAG